MKRKYISPELEVVRLSLNDVLSGSPTEGTVGEQIVTPELPGSGGLTGEGL